MIHYCSYCCIFTKFKSRVALLLDGGEDEIIDNGH